MEKSKVKPYSISEFIDTGLLRFVNIFFTFLGLLHVTVSVTMVKSKKKKVYKLFVLNAVDSLRLA